MGDKTGIAWTDATWNPLVGCTRVSEGCRHCYAERDAIRISGPGQKYEGVVRSTTVGPRWTGEVRLVEKDLDLPLRWKRPRRIFVNSMSDLFHEKVPDEWIATIFGIMNAAKDRHTFQILTKRPERMRAWFQWVDEQPNARIPGTENECRVGVCFGAAQKRGLVDYSLWWGSKWPLPNVWLGVSVEDQETADERIPTLLQTPAAARWVSYEPALTGVDFGCWLPCHRGDPSICFPGDERVSKTCCECGLGSPSLDWLVVGGESGPGARRLNVEWARKAIAQCRAAGVAAFVKQLGAFPVDRNDVGFTGWEQNSWPDGTEIEEHINGYREEYQGAPVRVKLRDRKGADIEEWPVDLRIREFPRG